MIRADTAPGTEVVCIDNSPGRFGPCGLDVGAVYTVDRIAPGLDRSPVVLLVEVTGAVAYEAPYGLVQIGYGLARFRYLDLPRSLTELLEPARVRKAREAVLQ